MKLHAFLHGKYIYKDILRYKCELYAQRTSNFTAAAGEISLFKQMALFWSQCWGDKGTREGLQCLYHISYGTTMWQNQTIDVPCIGGQLGHYLQGAGQAWSGQPGILTQGISCFQVKPSVLSLQELVGCHYGQRSTLSKSRASSGAVETASSWMQQQEQSLQDDNFRMGRAAPNLAGYRPTGGSQMQATGMYGEMQIASNLKQPQSSKRWQNT